MQLAVHLVVVAVVVVVSVALHPPAAILPMAVAVGIQYGVEAIHLN